MAWTTERVALLKTLWGKGFSASQIAVEIGHVTRNAVIGKVCRLGLSGRAKSGGRPKNNPITLAGDAPAKPRHQGPTWGANNADPIRSKLKGATTRAKGPVTLPSAPTPDGEHPARHNGTLNRIKLKVAEPPAIDDEANAAFECDGIVDLPDDQPPEGGVTIMELTETSCRWPSGDPRDPTFRYCGAHGALFSLGKPYCATHTAKAAGVRGRD